ncbi:phage terminase large subunit family protein [Methylobacterium soli]|uniref:phage terminase large subunit family protein n=1 Tax=Methylobacterium soli TaxID=553447 RepID=UPI001EE31950|nr:phage terminase large subunit family protein [Methylobacterium soli]
MTTLLDQTAAKALAKLRPPPRLPLSQWIERHMRLPEGLAAKPGPVRLWPFQKEIADAITDPMLERVTVRKCVRVGYTTLLTGAGRRQWEGSGIARKLMRPRLLSTPAYRPRPIMVSGCFSGREGLVMRSTLRLCK